MAKLVKDNPLAYEMYSRRAKNIGYNVGELQKIAELIEYDLSEIWFEDDRFKDSRERYIDDALKNVSPLKIEISKYIENNSKIYVNEYIDEIELFKKIGEKSVASVITTNYDTFIERNLKSFKKYIGQEELIFSNIQGVGEIYKIHGCSCDAGSIVINEKDYMEFEENNPYLAAKILTIFLEHPIIFLGYSLSDSNIKTILKSIVKCLSKEKLEIFKKRLVFIEWNNTKENDEISTHSISFDGDKTLEMIRIFIKDYSILYNEILNNKFKYNTTVLRRLKEEIYELVLTNEPTAKMKVVGINDDTNLDSVEFVMGVGVISDFGKKGYSTIEVKEVFEDVLFNNKDFHNDLIVTETLTNLVKQNNGSVPIYKYIKGFDKENLPERVKNEIKEKYTELLSRSILKNKKLLEYSNKNISDIINENKEDTSKILQLIPFIKQENIEIEVLGDFLRKYFKDNQSIFEEKNSSNFRRAVKLYDWLSNYQNGKES